ncbi:hypothetical protein A3A93_05885 [Candidatus Roizmanbacteria bacterium RIFCSPLOWO2_01_FULL_38_12]|uniref:Glycosyltransferase RgtA/B/C/D-like domain-containing protein n=1 Tax=Candidatus Roizmanbacteria bacterium RIFCSPLOWO2_01_FULL_38_12 TaxID=1802061 RepID=A0A1F7IV90_9BACT|nr:MAG: hypothetical protein A3F59_00025 [Candidatus Roizmanbacteria bacterium RIFCSPHIGHO2_12_FULL_38_13]OGK47289.1 MAG: hypothetical protein A3A93_05885 [Candidatus Roizmanbacteria bacterium RIFCSPLOWO2_01_FULL_38_12]
MIKRIIQLGSLFPIILTIFFIKNYSINVPYQDQWEMVPLFQKVIHAEISIFDLIAQHNEHRILFPRLIQISLAFLTNWNIKNIYWISFILLCAIYFFLALFMQNICKNKYFCIYLQFMLSWIVFSPIQYEGWFTGMNEFHLTILAMLMTIYLLNLPLLGTTATLSKIFAVFLSIIGSYSHINGLLIWIVGGILIFYRRQFLFLIFWMLLSLMTYLIYFINYSKPIYHPSLMYFFQNPLDFLTYFFGQIGSVLFISEIGISALIGIMIFLIALFNLNSLLKKRSLIKSCIPWLMIFLFSLLSILAIAVARAGFGTTQALSSRYIVYSSLMFISTIEVFYYLVGNYKIKFFSHDLFILLFSFVLIFSIGQNYLKGVDYIKKYYSEMSKIKYCLDYYYRVDSTCLYSVYPNKEVLLERLEYIKQLGWGGFSEFAFSR